MNQVAESKSVQQVQGASPVFVTIPMPRGLELTKSPGMQDTNLDVQQAPGAMYAPEARPQADLDPRSGEAMAVPAAAAAAATASELKPNMAMGASSNAASPHYQLAGSHTKTHQVKMPASGAKDSKYAGPSAGFEGSEWRGKGRAYGNRKGGEVSAAKLAADKMVQPRTQADGPQSELGDSVESGSRDDLTDEDGASEGAGLAHQQSTLSEENGSGGVRATSLWWESLLRKTHSKGDSALQREPSRGFSRSNTDACMSELVEDGEEASPPGDSARRSQTNPLRPSDSDSSVNPAWKAMSDLAGADNELAAVLVRRKLIAEGRSKSNLGSGPE